MKGLVLALLLVAAPALAASPPPMMKTLLDHMAQGGRDPRVGDWVTYQLNGGGARVHYWRMAVVGEEKDRHGRPALWYEMEMGTHPAMRSPLGQMKVLIARQVKPGEPHAISRLIMANGFDKPQEYAPEALDYTLGEIASSQAKVRASAKPMAPPTLQTGKETRLMTFAGTLTAVPVEMKYRNTVVRRLWMSREVPVVHLARIEIPGIQQMMDLYDYGVDAKPRMLMPEPNAPKVQLEYADESFPSLPEESTP
jgi:hypothetical protein